MLMLLIALGMSAEVEARTAPALARAALAQAPPVAAAVAKTKAAEADVDGADALDDPMLELGLAPLSVPAPFTNAPVPLGFEAMLSQALPLSRRRSFEKGAAKAAALAVAAEEELVRLEIENAAATLACDAWLAAREIDAIEHHAALIESLKGAVESELVAGRGSVTDAQRIDEERLRLDAERIMAQAQRDAVDAQTNAFLSRSLDAILPAPPSDAPLLPRPPIDPAEAETRERAELAVARNREDAARLLHDAASEAWIPDVKARIGYSSMWPDVEHQFMVGVALDLPVQDARRRSARDRADAEAAMQNAEYRDAIRTINANRVVAERLLDAAEKALALHDDKLLPLARLRSASSRDALGSGAGRVMDAVEALRNERHALLDAERARAEVCHRRAALWRATGRSFVEVTP
jgi:outer membrane protein, heavy metal efflux system